QPASLIRLVGASIAALGVVIVMWTRSPTREQPGESDPGSVARGRYSRGRAYRAASSTPGRCALPMTPNSTGLVDLPPNGTVWIILIARTEPTSQDECTYGCLIRHLGIHPAILFTGAGSEMLLSASS